ncbi:hypothetical protein [Schlesneria paludicola]|uniref:hypothetical protein n=1 Tax=Schlesneria paludicola TaxID=360056 RepID=UPI000299F35F|nr:hypothetical protein [Schlesneria paludicola]
MSLVDRRDFLRELGGTLVTGGAALQSLLSLSMARAEDLQVTPSVVRFRPEMEDVASWIEQTPREQILQKAVERLKAGMGYRQLVGGLFLAGIRNIKPRPVGFKFHAVMVINSAHQLSLDAAQPDRLLPFFWALDNFKSAQAQDVKEGDWVLAPVNEAAVPTPSKSRERFIDAMNRWDSDAADVAVAGLCRSGSATEVMEVIWPYAIRDWQNIGHKAIFAAQAWRTLELIGWEHAEPVMRSLVFGLLNGGPGDSAIPYDVNLELVKQIRPDWMAGRIDPMVTTSLVQALRQATPKDAALAVVSHLNQGASAASLWDALLLAASELLMRQQAIVPLHATTATNALFYIFRESGSDSTRLLSLLQAASWIVLFREGTRARGGFPDKPNIDEFQPSDQPPAQLETVFVELQQDRNRAAAQTLAYARAGGAIGPFFDAARHLIFTKGTDAHDFKFAASAFEDIQNASPAVRPQLLAASVYYLRSAGENDSPLLQRTREALAVL